MKSETDSTRSPLTLGWEFFKIGCVAFGGFMAVISVIEDVFVRKLGWIKQEEMLDGVSLANVLPGPQAVNTVTYVGYTCGGRKGALASFVGILTPTYILVTGLTFLYFEYAQGVPSIESFFTGLVLAVVAVIFNVVWRMQGKCLQGPLTWGLALMADASVLTIPTDWKLRATLGVLALAALLGSRVFRTTPDPVPAVAGDKGGSVLPLVALPLLLSGLYLLDLPIPKDGLIHVAITFAGLSVLLFGGGYVFIPMIMHVVVEQEGWLTLGQFNDGIAMSQVTPGPIVISAAFIGQKVLMEQGALWGIVGGLVATLAIFGPPALLMVAASQMLERVKGSGRVQGALKGARAAIVGMIAAAGVTILLSEVGGGDPVGGVDPMRAAQSFGILILSLLALVRFKLPVVMVIPAAGGLGLLLL